MSVKTFICTANRGFAQQAQEELRRLWPVSPAFGWLVPGEVFTISSEVSEAEAVQAVNANEPIFLRHWFPVYGELAWNGEWDPTGGALRGELDALRERLAGKTVAVQVRKAESLSAQVSLGAVKQALDEWLERDYGAASAVRGADEVLSVFLTESTVYYGISRPDHNLSDWAGGAVRFRKEEGQISRAKFKLLEAELAFGLDFTGYRHALDIGAAPGGWTSLLLERGLDVTAVDPAKLDASLLRHPGLTYHGKKADDVRFAPNAFDLLVCDMSWSHRQMAKLVKGLCYALQPGGTAIITVKLMHKKAFQTIREVVGDLSDELALQQGKQLFHNREELTLFFIRN